jgi:hypothetical protein
VDIRFKTVYTSVKAIFFFGTPHRGASYVNLGLTVRKLAACAGFDTNDVLLRNLKFDSTVAKLLREEFAKMLDERRPKSSHFKRQLAFQALVHYLERSVWLSFCTSGLMKIRWSKTAHPNWTMRSSKKTSFTLIMSTCVDSQAFKTMGMRRPRTA